MDDSPLLMVGFVVGLVWGFTALETITNYALHILMMQIFGVVSLIGLIVAILLFIIEARLLIPLVAGVFLGAILHVVLASHGISVSAILDKVIAFLKKSSVHTPR